MAFLISLRGDTTLTESFAVLTAVKKRYGRERSRSGGMKWRKDSSTRRRFVAEFAGARSKNKARRLDACTCRGSNGKNRRAGNPRRSNLHDIQLRLVSLGTAVGRLASLTAIFAKIALEAVDSDFSAMGGPMKSRAVVA